MAAAQNLGVSQFTLYALLTGRLIATRHYVIDEEEKQDVDGGSRIRHNTQLPQQ